MSCAARCRELLGQQRRRLHARARAPGARLPRTAWRRGRGQGRSARRARDRLGRASGGGDAGGQAVSLRLSAQRDARDRAPAAMQGRGRGHGSPANPDYYQENLIGAGHHGSIGITTRSGLVLGGGGAHRPPDTSLDAQAWLCACVRART